MTVRERIKVIQKDMAAGGLLPEAVRNHLMVANGLLGYVLEEQRAADAAYKRVLLDAYNVEGKANRAKLVAENTDEYRRLREADDAEKLTEEMIRSCKVFLRSLDEEMRLSA